MLALIALFRTLHGTVTKDTQLHSDSFYNINLPLKHMRMIRRDAVASHVCVLANYKVMCVYLKRQDGT